MNVRPILWRGVGLGVLAASLCGGLAMSQVDTPQAPPGPESAGSATVVEDRPEFAIPTTKDRAGRIVAAVHLAGQGPFRFILDTGANRSALSQRVADRLGLTSTEQFLVHGITGSAVMPMVVVPELRAGSLRFREQRLAVLPDAVFAGMDGILGIDTLQRAHVEVDFGSDRVTISRSGRAVAEDRAVVRARLRRGGLLLVPARVGKVRVKAIIDTGAERSLGNEKLRTALRELERPELGGVETDVVGATAQVAQGYSFVAPTIEIGRSAFVGNLTVTFGDFHVFKVWSLLEEPALVIGMDALGTLPQFSIDYPRREFQLKLPYDHPPLGLARDTCGGGLLPLGRCFRTT